MVATDKQDKSAQADGYDSRIVNIRRTTKVREGGRDFSFSAVAVVGDGNGRVGYGLGKAKEVVLAVQKANEAAKRNMIHITLRGDTLFHPVTVNYGATTVNMLPCAEGTGIIAGGAMRPLFEVLGLKNVIAKTIGSANPVNVIRAVVKGLESMRTPDLVAAKRGKTVAEILGRERK